MLIRPLIGFLPEGSSFQGVVPAWTGRSTLQPAGRPAIPVLAGIDIDFRRWSGGRREGKKAPLGCSCLVLTRSDEPEGRGAAITRRFVVHHQHFREDCSPHRAVPETYLLDRDQLYGLAFRFVRFYRVLFPVSFCNSSFFAYFFFQFRYRQAEFRDV